MSLPVGRHRADDAVAYERDRIISPANRDRRTPHRRPGPCSRSAPCDSGRLRDRHADRFSNAASSPCRGQELRCVSTVQFQDVAGQAAHSEAVRSRPFPEPSSQIIRIELSLLGCLSNDDRLGEVIVVRVAGCRRDLADSVRVRPCDLPFRPTLLDDPEEIAGRDANHEAAGTVVHAIRLQRTYSLGSVVRPGDSGSLELLPPGGRRASTTKARSLRRRTLAARNGSPAHALSSVSGRLRRSAGRGGFSVVGEQRAKFGPRGPHGPPETAVRVDLPPWRAAFPASYAAISTCRRLTFNARHTKSHSQRTFASPRKLKRRKPSACLIQP